VATQSAALRKHAGRETADRLTPGANSARASVQLKKDICFYLTVLSRPAATTGARTAAMLKLANSLGFAAPSPVEISQARALAAALMRQQVASVEAYLSVQQIQPASTLVYRQDGEVTGVVANLLLRHSAVAMLRTGRFDGMAIALDLLSRSDERPDLYYIWGIAGATQRASAAVAGLTIRLRYEPLADLDAYALAATPMGRRLGVTRLGFRPLRHADDNLIMSPRARLDRAA
jgi:hypothetical protein